MPLHIKQNKKLELRTRTGKKIKSTFVNLSSRPGYNIKKSGLNKPKYSSIYVPTTPQRHQKTLQLSSNSEKNESQDYVLAETSGGMLSGKGPSEENEKKDKEANNSADTLEVREKEKNDFTDESSHDFNVGESLRHPVKVKQVELKRLLANVKKQPKKKFTKHTFKII